MHNPFKSLEAKPKNAHYDGEDSDEEILYILRKSFITNYKWIFMTVLFVFLPLAVNATLFLINKGSANFIPVNLALVANIFWYLFVFGFAFANYVNWFFNVYIITNKKLVDMDFVGLLYKNISETPLANVEDVTSNISGVFGTVFNIGDVRIQTAAEEKEFDFELVGNPSKVRDIISDLLLSSHPRPE